MLSKVIAATDQPTWLTILMACGAVAMIFVTMIYAAVVWSRHGMFPAKHLRKGSRLRNLNEGMNRQMGWGDGDEEESDPEPPILKGDSSADVTKQWPS
jgi:hypothetical protein